MQPDCILDSMKNTLGHNCLLYIALLLSVFTVWAQPTPNNPLQMEAIALQKILESKHFNPKPINDTLSRQILWQLMERLDGRHLYFMDSDWQDIIPYTYQLDDEIKGGSWKFLSFITVRYKERLQHADAVISELTQKPFVFSTAETISFANKDEKDSLYFAHTEKEYIQRWTKWLKYQTLNEMVSNMNEIIEGNLTKITAHEPTARKKVQHAEQRQIKQLLEEPGGYEKYIASLFLDAVATCFDPHSNYFSQSGREDFTSSLATEGMSFGLDLDENDNGEVVIDRLVPGGPAWKSNELHKGDVLTTLQWANKTPIDLTDADIDEVEGMLHSSEEKLILTVRQASGLIKKVTLVQEKIREDENIVKGFILKGEKKIGYISLPGFYTEWEEDGSSKGCANDVAKEILKMKEAHIEGLILDIRDNGGGSLQEGLNLAGIFIEEGALGVLQGNDHKPFVMKDMNRGTIYDGPLVVMVNGQSASASELLAATLQDYNRAVIVGSTTFGKATGQTILPLSTEANPGMLKTARTEWGHVKVTINKIYRVTGKSAQMKGVQPQVYQPDIYESIDYSEATQPYALPSDSISKKIYYTPLKPLPVADLSQKSAKRIAANASFQTIRELVDFQRERRGKVGREIVLHPSYFRTVTLESYKRLQNLEKALDKETSLFSVENTRYDQQVMQMDTYGKEINDILKENIRKNIYIEEAYQVINDLISLIK